MIPYNQNTRAIEESCDLIGFFTSFVDRDALIVTVGTLFALYRLSK